MGLETGTFISDLVPTNPIGPSDPKSQGDDHLRLIKNTAQNTFPNASKPFYFPRTQTLDADYAPIESEENTHFLYDLTTADRTVTLPVLPSTKTGWQIRVTKVDATTKAVVVAGTINRVTNYRIFRQNESVVFTWSGTEWFAGQATDLPWVVTTKTATANLLATEMFGAVIVSPAADTVIQPFDGPIGSWVWIKNLTGAHLVTIDPSGAGTIDGAATLVLSQANEAVCIFKIAANTWVILTHKIDITVPTVTPLKSGVTNLLIKFGAVSPAQRLDITADEAVLVDGAGGSAIFNNVSLTLNLGGPNGANGIDTGSLAANRKYYIWLIGKTDRSAIACLAHSGTSGAPTMPADYTFKKLVGWCRVDGTSNLYQMIQRQADAQYVVAGALPPDTVPQLGIGPVGAFNINAPTLVNADWSDFAPIEATKLTILFNSQAGGTGPAQMIIAPNTNYGGSADGPLGANKQLHNFWYQSSDFGIGGTIEIVPESTNIAWCASNAGGKIGLLGWRVPWV